jgi:mitotic spindle assembly checkpoint protein MAD2
VNSILFQRGIYPAEDFAPQQQYGLTILMSKDEKIMEFLKNVLGQAEDWLAQNKIEKFSLVISNVHTKEVLECWDFKIDSEMPDNQNQDPNIIDPNNPPTSSKELKKIQLEIGAVMRQIAATVSYLPLLDCTCSFDLLVHTLKDCDVPDNWNETENVTIKNQQTVHLKSFSTGLQKVNTVVSYRMNE